MAVPSREFVVDAHPQDGYHVLVATGDEERNEDQTTRDKYHIGSAKLFIATKTDLAPINLPDSPEGGCNNPLAPREGVLRLTQITLLGPNGAVRVTTDRLYWRGRCAFTSWD